MRNTLRLVIGIVLALGLTPRGQAGTNWYVVELGGAHAGWMRSTETPIEGGVRTEQAMLLEVRRDGAVVELRFESWFEETDAGEPIRMGSRQFVGGGEVVREGVFDRQGIAVVTVQGDRRTESREPRPSGSWLTPASARRFVEQRAASGAERISYRSIDPLNGFTPVSYERVRGETVETEALRRTFEAVRWTVTTNATPGVETAELIDAEGVLVRSSTRFGDSDLTMRLATESEALGEREPPELLTTTFVRPDRVIESARRVRSASYVLRVPGGAMPDVPESSAQRVERLSPDAVRVRIEADGFPERSRVRPDRANTGTLASTALLDHEDPAVRALVGRAIAGASSPAARAEAMRRFVYGYITEKHLDVAFGSASETARSRAGDCTEHAALLAAMLRADGIPSKLVIGLIYADTFAGEREIFAYHMWVRALVEIDGRTRWVDLDATLGSGVAFDATHIALATSLGDQGVTDAGFARLVPLMGRLTIEVESVSERAGGGR